jgi:Flp pilus assembly pilin Flp
LIIGVVAIGLIGSLTVLKGQIEGLFTVVSTGLAGA